LKRGILLVPPGLKDVVFPSDRIEKLKDLLELTDGSSAMGNREQLLRLMPVQQIIVSTWGMPRLDDEFLDHSPELEAVFYAAGTVKGFVTDSVWNRGIVIQSSWSANAVPVAEFTVSQITLGLKNYWTSVRLASKAPCHGCYGKRVGLIGYGMIGRRVRKLLRAWELEVAVYDPYLAPEAASKDGVSPASLDEIFETCHCVSLHAPNIPQTRGMIREEHFRRMIQNSCFINTARGAIVDEGGLIRAMKDRPDITCLLDVTDPEPAPADSPLRSLPNIIISPHIAGSLDGECVRMADYSIDELGRYLNGQPLLYEVSRDMIDRMA
jgi:phosphoglycerate dehydrogenase-like enzyme